MPADRPGRRAVEEMQETMRTTTKSLSISWIILVLVVAFAAGAGLVLWHMSRLSSNLLESEAVDSTELYSQSVADFRALYASEVVNRLKGHKIEVTHDYSEKEAAIPLPATLTIALGKQISQKETGLQVRLYSDYPFPWRKDEARQDAFEREAIRHLTEHPEQHFARIEEFEGRKSIRYARADRMQKSCVDCHNTHPDSPKKDWKVGDVRGVLEVIRPLDKMAAQTSADLRGTLFLLGGLGLLGVGVLSFFIHRLRQTAEIQRRSAERERILEAIRQAVQRLSSAGAEILATTTQQPAGGQEQAAAVSQTVTTVTEVAQTAEQGAQRAKSVGEAVQRTQQIGQNGRKAVGDAIVALSAVKDRVESTAENILALAEQAQAIGEIIATVNDIAEQTNLLALNAAIEASRAGEHGKGFTVVASEVKALADLSKKATMQVRQILGRIQKATNSPVLATEEVTKGVVTATTVADQAGETIQTLADTLSQTAQAASQIVATAGQQSVGMSQINQAMRNIEQVTKQNLVAVRQTEQAAQELTALGNRLAQLASSDEEQGPADVDTRKRLNGRLQTV